MRSVTPVIVGVPEGAVEVDAVAVAAAVPAGLDHAGAAQVADVVPDGTLGEPDAIGEVLHGGIGVEGDVEEQRALL